MKTLIGGVGYTNLRDHSAGGAVIDRLATRSWPPAVSVEDASYNPIAFVQRLDDEPADGRFTRAIFVAALPRPGRAPGEVSIYRWDGALPDATAIQAAVAEAVTGVISLDNTLVVARHFQALPAEVIVIEIEPETHEFGDAFSPAVARAIDQVERLLLDVATDPAASARIPLAPLGGGRPLGSPLG